MKTVTVKTAELEGAALDWAVGISINDGKEGARHFEKTANCQWGDSILAKVKDSSWSPSTNWSQGGPLIEKYSVSVVLDGQYNASCKSKEWHAYINLFTYYEEWSDDGYAEGGTPLIAAMRAIVASELGDTVEIPEELAK